MAVQIIPPSDRGFADFGRGLGQVGQSLAGIAEGVERRRLLQRQQEMDDLLNQFRERSLALDEQRLAESIRSAQARESAIGRELDLRGEALNASKESEAKAAGELDLKAVAQLMDLRDAAEARGDLQSARAFNDRLSAMLSQSAAPQQPSFTQAAGLLGVGQQGPLDLERPVGAAAEEPITPPPSSPGGIGRPSGIIPPQGGAGEIGAPSLAIPPQAQVPSSPITPTQPVFRNQAGFEIPDLTQPGLLPTPGIVPIPQQIQPAPVAKLDPFSAAQADFPLVPQDVLRQVLEDAVIDDFERGFLSRLTKRAEAEEQAGRQRLVQTQQNRALDLLGDAQIIADESVNEPAAIGQAIAGLDVADRILQGTPFADIAAETRRKLEGKLASSELQGESGVTGASTPGRAGAGQITLTPEGDIQAGGRPVTNLASDNPEDVETLKGLLVRMAEGRTVGSLDKTGSGAIAGRDLRVGDAIKARALYAIDGLLAIRASALPEEKKAINSAIDELRDILDDDVSGVNSGNNLVGLGDSLRKVKSLTGLDLLDTGVEGRTLSADSIAKDRATAIGQFASFEGGTADPVIAQSIVFAPIKGLRTAKRVLGLDLGAGAGQQPSAR